MLQETILTYSEKAELRGIAKGKKEGRIEGKKEGRIEGRIESLEKTAKKLLERDMSLQDIAEILELSIDRIQALKGP